MAASLLHYTQCPFCNSEAIAPALEAKDYTVSGERFAIWHCKDCTNRFTQDVPDASAIGAYYQSQDYISHSDTAQGFVNRLYHLVRKRTLHSKRKLVQQLLKEQAGKVLDIGAGTGAFAHTLHAAGIPVLALEPDAGARDLARHKYGLDLLDTAALVGLGPGEFSVITLWHVLEHVHDLHPYLKKFAEILPAGGYLVIAVPNYTSYDADKYQACWAAYDVPRHLYHFSPAGIAQMLAEYGFSLEKRLPMWFDSFYVSMLSEQYSRGQGNIVGAMMTGLISNIYAFTDPAKCSSVIYLFRKEQVG
ncbi:MAG TPA: class I SAM-dependent methyltransferase [Sediminibacterium sp.]|nr:class I SAM-dependent methyltransferase [Sediminibacterium sp.]